MRLPVFEEEADPTTRDITALEESYKNRKPPTSIVVRYGSMRMVGEYPYDGPAKPGCGSKMVARTSRGLEVVEMLTTTCPNSGCGKSVSRKEVLGYIENSGGADYPFKTNGKILRVASIDDLNRWSDIQSRTRERVSDVKAAITRFNLEENMKLVELEPILSEEQLTVFYTSEARIDFRELVQWIAREFSCRIEMRQVGARDEARLVADYERCGQHCCCQNFLKVLKPVSMRSAKIQKATLDPLKISGRCGRLMCCLRYEDETYSELKSRLPHKKTRVGTPEGPGLVIDSKILVQLVLVSLEKDGRSIAVPVEELCDPDDCPDNEAAAPVDPLRGMPVEKLDTASNKKAPRKRRRQSGKGADVHNAQQDSFRKTAKGEDARPGSAEGSEALGTEADGSAPKTKKKRRRRRRKGGGDASTPEQSPGGGGSGPQGSDGEAQPRKKRRRRRRRGGDGGGDGGGNDKNSSNPPSTD
jgi:cell fate regulator YaaT (PSP1 superfamily)